MSGMIRSEADKEGSRFVGVVFVFDDDGITDSFHDGVIVEGAAEYLS